MTISELSSEFDILYNNATSNQAPGLSEYEKSVFLTQAQEAIITELYNGNLQTSFESNEDVTRYLSSLITTDIINSENIKEDINNLYNAINSSIYKAELKSDILFIVYEGASLTKKDDDKKVYKAIVTPSKHDNIYKLVENPFRGPTLRRVLRLSVGDNSVELLSAYPITTYVVRYLKKPNPIILSDLSDVTINNKDSETTSLDVPEVLHRTILMRAVQLAKAVWQS